MIENFPGNSHKAERTTIQPDLVPVEKKVESVVTGKVVRRKKTFGRRFMDTFFSGEGVGAYLIRDVVIPALQNLATDFVIQGVEKAVYGEARSPRRVARPSAASRTHISYDRYGGPGPISRSVSPTPRERRPVRPSAFQLGEVVLETRIDATNVLEKMYEILENEQYGVVTVADLNNMLKQTSEYTDHKWGWTDLRGSTVRAIREGFLLILPEPEDLR